MQTNYSLQLNIVGYGVGGSIDGQRLETTLTRGPATNSIDFGVPYLYAGTIKPAPVNTTRVVDNFDDNVLTGWYWQGPGTTYPLIESNQQFTVRGQWPGIQTHMHADTYAWGVLVTNWSVANYQTLEWRVDLVGMSEDATNAASIVASSYNLNGQFYVLYKGLDFVELGKMGGRRLGRVLL